MRLLVFYLKNSCKTPGLINIDEHHNQHDLAKFVSDYIAGMTDRFAIQTFEKLLPTLRSRIQLKQAH